MSIESDLLFMLEDWGARAVTVGTFSGKRPVEETEFLQNDGTGDPVLIRGTAIRSRLVDHSDPDGVLTLTRGTAATVDGVTYSVSDWRLEGNGHELLIWIRKV